MNKYVPLCIISSALLTACVPTHLRGPAQQAEPPYTGAASAEQIQAAIENAVDSLDDQYNITTVSRSKLETLFGVDLALTNATPIKDKKRWKTLTNDGLFFITLFLANDATGQSSYTINWKQQATTDYFDGVKAKTPPITTNCLNPKAIKPFLQSRGWHPQPGLANWSFPAYVHSNDPNSTVIVLGGTTYNTGDKPAYGPCLTEVVIVKYKPKGN